MVSLSASTMIRTPRIAIAIAAVMKPLMIMIMVMMIIFHIHFKSFLSTLVALHSTLVGQSLDRVLNLRSFEACELVSCVLVSRVLLWYSASPWSEYDAEP